MPATKISKKKKSSNSGASSKTYLQSEKTIKQQLKELIDNLVDGQDAGEVEADFTYKLRSLTSKKADKLKPFDLLFATYLGSDMITPVFFTEHVSEGYLRALIPGNYRNQVSGSGSSYTTNYPITDLFYAKKEVDSLIHKIFSGRHYSQSLNSSYFVSKLQSIVGGDFGPSIRSRYDGTRRLRLDVIVDNNIEYDIVVTSGCQSYKLDDLINIHRYLINQGHIKNSAYKDTDLDTAAASDSMSDLEQQFDEFDGMVDLYGLGVTPRTLKKYIGSDTKVLVYLQNGFSNKPEYHLARVVAHDYADWFSMEVYYHTISGFASMQISSENVITPHSATKHIFEAYDELESAIKEHFSKYKNFKVKNTSLPVLRHATSRSDTVLTVTDRSVRNSYFSFSFSAFDQWMQRIYARLEEAKTNLEKENGKSKDQDLEIMRLSIPGSNQTSLIQLGE